MDKILSEFREKIQFFIKEALPIAKKTATYSSILGPQYRLERQGNSELIVCYLGDPVWGGENLIGNIGLIGELQTYKDALKICKEDKLFDIFNAKFPFGFGSARGMDLKYIPFHFLASMINFDRCYNFRQEKFDRIFSDFITIVSDRHYSNARVIAPLIGISIQEDIYLGNGKRIRKIGLNETIYLLNKFPSMACYYSQDNFEKFTHVLEIDHTINWTFISSTENEDYERIARDQANLFSRRKEINDELILLRALTKSCITIKNLCIDYRGWLANWTGGGLVNGHNILPWGLPKIRMKADIQTYLDYREKYLKLIDENSQKRIYFAMRKLAFGLEKEYGCDEIFDTISGLEGLLVPSITNGNRTRKKQEKCIDTAVPLLTGKIQDSTDLKKDLEDAYNFRNDVAHGDFVYDDPDLILGSHPYDEEFAKTISEVRRIRSITRDSLHEAIKI